MKVKTRSGEIRIWEFNNSLKTTGVKAPIVRGYARDITEHKKAEEKLKTTMSQLQYVYNTLDNCFWGADIVNKKMLYVSPGTEKVYGYSEKEFLENPNFWIEVVLEEDKHKFDEIYPLINKGKTATVEFRIRHADSSVKWVESRMTPTLDATGKLIMLDGITIDITERKHVEETLHNEQYLMQTLMDNLPDHIYFKDNESRFIRINRSQSKIFGLDDPSQAIGKTDFDFFSKEHATTTCNDEQAIMLTGQPISKDEKETWPDGSISYVLSTKMPWRNVEGNIVGTFGISKNITERKKMEEVLEASEKNLRQVLSSTPDIFYVIDKNYRITLINQTAEKMLSMAWGKPVRLGANILDLIPGEKNEPIKESFERVLAGERIEYELREDLPEWFLVTYSPVSDSDGNVAGVYVVTKDITERKKAEEEMKRSEEKYRQLFHNSPLPMWVTEIGNKRFIDVNETAIRQYGYNREEFLQMDVWKLRPGKDDGEFNKWLDEHYDDSIVHSGVWQHVRKNKSIIDVDVTSHRIIYENKPCRLIVANDITEKRKAEIAMQEALKRYNILAEATSDTIWDWNITKNKIHYNYGITKTFGYDITEVENIPGWWKKNIHPEDIDYVNELLGMTFIKKKQTVQLSYRYRCADNSYKYILDRATVIYDEKENPMRMIGAMQDVTNEKEQEFRIGKAIVDAQEEERHQMGMELHDNVNQILGASLLYLSMTKPKEKSRDFISETIEQSSQYIKDAIAEIRKLSHQLAPASFESVSLKEVFESLIANVNANNLFEVCLHFDDFEKNKIRSDIQTNLYRILQEQMNNINKYSKASKVEVGLTLSDTIVKLRIVDNGIGFDPALVKKGIGLENIRRRTKLFSGRFTLSSSPGNGCIISVEIPY